MLAPVQPRVAAKASSTNSRTRMRFARAYDDILRRILLQQSLPDGFNIFRRVAPVAPGVEISKEQSVLLARNNVRHSAR